MSKHNKVNKSNYVQRGRLTPDEMARERIRQAEVSSHAKGKENVIGKVPSPPVGRGSNPRRNEPEE
jgi:hypothetical protein